MIAKIPIIKKTLFYTDEKQPGGNVFRCFLMFLDIFRHLLGTCRPRATIEVNRVTRVSLSSQWTYLEVPQSPPPEAPKVSRVKHVRGMSFLCAWPMAILLLLCLSLYLRDPWCFHALYDVLWRVIASRVCVSVCAPMSMAQNIWFIGCCAVKAEVGQLLWCFLMLRLRQLSLKHLLQKRSAFWDTCTRKAQEITAYLWLAGYHVRAHSGSFKGYHMLKLETRVISYQPADWFKMIQGV